MIWLASIRSWWFRRTVYASTVDEDALIYRKNRNLLDKDEQMAILVQRVSGSSYGDYFYPQLASNFFSQFNIEPRLMFLCKYKCAYNQLFCQLERKRFSHLFLFLCDWIEILDPLPDPRGSDFEVYLLLQSKVASYNPLRFLIRFNFKYLSLILRIIWIITLFIYFRIFYHI